MAPQTISINISFQMALEDNTFNVSSGQTLEILVPFKPFRPAISDSPFLKLNY